MQEIINIMTKSNEIENKNQWIESIKKQLGLGGRHVDKHLAILVKMEIKMKRGAIAIDYNEIQGLKIF